jgi:hypothetical protein
MSKKTLIIIAIIVAAILTFSIIFFNIFFIKYEKETRSIPSVKAIKNPFLAAERYLTQIGMNAQSLSDRRLLIDLPSVNDLILINRFGANLPEDREELLISWVENGGSLIVTANRLWDEKLFKSGNNLLDRYDIRPIVKLKDKKDHFSWNIETQNPVFEIEIGENKTAEVSFLSEKIIIDVDGIADKKQYGKNGDHIIQINIGQGRLIFLSDNEFLKNNNLDKNDHAYFLAHLVQGRSERGVQNRSKIWLLYSNNMPSLLSVIWNNACCFVVCFFILLLLCILRLNLKSGPLIPVNNNTRRNLMEHLEALGNFLFKLDKGAEMLKKVQKLTRRYLKDKYFFTTQKTRSEQSAKLAEQINIPVQTVHDALFGDVEDEHDFINKSRVLQELNISFKASLKR